MQKNILLIILVLFTFSCKKEQNPLPLSVDYISCFSTESRPIAIAVDKISGYIYVANHDPGINYYSMKIQKFSREGILIQTTADFETFDKGNYLSYTPVDITIDNNQNLYVLVRPMDETGFCILQFDFVDTFKKEYDFSKIYGEMLPSALAFSNKHIYVTNGRILKIISIESEQVFDIMLPFNEDNKITWPDIHTTDMAVDVEGIVYLTGQANFGNDSLGCHITKYNPSTNQRITTYSRGTGFMAAMLNNPGISLGSKENIYLATFYGMSLEVFNKNMEFIMCKEIRPVNNEDTFPIDVATYNNSIYIVDNFNSLIYVYKEN